MSNSNAPDALVPRAARRARWECPWSGRATRCTAAATQTCVAPKDPSIRLGLRLPVRRQYDGGACVQGRVQVMLRCTPGRAEGTGVRGSGGTHRGSYRLSESCSASDDRRTTASAPSSSLSPTTTDARRSVVIELRRERPWRTCGMSTSRRARKSLAVGWGEWCDACGGGCCCHGNATR